MKNLGRGGTRPRYGDALSEGWDAPPQFLRFAQDDRTLAAHHERAERTLDSLREPMLH